MALFAAVWPPISTIYERRSVRINRPDKRLFHLKLSLVRLHLHCSPAAMVTLALRLLALLMALFLLVASAFSVGHKTVSVRLVGAPR